jgi:hypothetical protein
MKEIVEGDIGPESWGFLITKHNKASAQRPFFDKIIPFLCRVGLISNNKFIITGSTDARELCDNQFDINYWSNL